MNDLPSLSPTDAPVLAAGIDTYLAATRRAPGPPPSAETARLIADRDARRIACPRPAGMTVCDSYVAAGGSETHLRLYRPQGDGQRAAIVYFHGGGFTMGSVESYDSLAPALAEATGAIVISADYARLPDTTLCAMLSQCLDVLAWTRRMAATIGVDPGRIAVAGDSAGAFLATHVAARARTSGGAPLLCQLLCYGVYDLVDARASHRAARDPVLTSAVLGAIIGTYRACQLRDAVPLPPPLDIEDLSGSPPAIMLGAEHDPVLVEGADYAGRLRAAGVAVEARIAPAMCHGFLRAVRFSPAARDEMRWLGEAFRRLSQSTRTF